MKRQKVIQKDLYPKGEDIFFGIVSPAGTDLDLICAAIDKAMQIVDYQTQLIRLSDILYALPEGKDIPKDLKEQERLDRLMTAGSTFRKRMQQGDALAAMAMLRVRELREELVNGETRHVGNCAWIFRSLKHESEVNALRAVYGESFHLIGAYCPTDTRRNYLAKKLAGHDPSWQDYLAKADVLIKRDEAEDGAELGQNVRKAFPKCDLFLNIDSEDSAISGIKRYVELLFGNTLKSPTQDELGMFHAAAASLRSSSLGRQVGAAICTLSGDLLASGTNDVPKAFGGLYWESDKNDDRDHVKRKEDSNDKTKRHLVEELLDALRADLLPEIAELDKSLLFDHVRSRIKGTRVMNVIEYGRAVHAEMDALISAARLGTVVNGCTLLTTTFPCHECTRHIVAAGIRKVIFIEPYPKSLAIQLFHDSISIDDETKASTHVLFKPFLGISPNKFQRLFSMGDLPRKDSNGKVVEAVKKSSQPKLSEPFYSYVFREILKCREISEKNPAGKEESIGTN